MKTFRFKNVAGVVNTPEAGRDAQIVGERLEQIRAAKGKLTPKIVVDDARPADAPLHPYFEWRDNVAAERWRVTQAQNLIAAVHVVETTENREPVVTRAFIHVDHSEDPRYETVATVLDDAALYLQVCRRASAELEAFQERYAQFQSLKSIGKTATDAVQLELAGAIAKAEAAA